MENWSDELEFVFFVLETVDIISYWLKRKGSIQLVISRSNLYLWWRGCISVIGDLHISDSAVMF